MMKELQSLGLDVCVLDQNGEEVDMKQHFDDDDIPVRKPAEDGETLEMNHVADDLEGYTLEDDEGNAIEQDDDDDLLFNDEQDGDFDDGDGDAFDDADQTEEM